MYGAIVLSGFGRVGIFMIARSMRIPLTRRWSAGTRWISFQSPLRCVVTYVSMLLATP